MLNKNSMLKNGVIGCYFIYKRNFLGRRFEKFSDNVTKKQGKLTVENH